MRICFAGTDSFAEKIFTCLHAQEDMEVCAVITKPPRPCGRGGTLQQPPVYYSATEKKVAVFQPVEKGDIERALQKAAADMLVVASFGSLLSKEALSNCRLGAINIHASLLPRWRGASPIAHSILCGDKETGISIMQMNEELDTGAVYAKASLPLTGKETEGSLREKLAQLAVSMLPETLKGIAKGTITPTQQDEEQASYAPCISKKDAFVGSDSCAEDIERASRAYSPWPRLRVQVGKEAVQLHEVRCSPLTAKGRAGTFFEKDGTLYMNAADGVVEVVTIQIPGKKKMGGAEALKGARWLVYS